MTDGNNDMPTNATYTAYGRLSQGRLGTTDEGDAEDEMDTRFVGDLQCDEGDGG